MKLYFTSLASLLLLQLISSTHGNVQQSFDVDVEVMCQDQNQLCNTPIKSSEISSFTIRFVVKNDTKILSDGKYRLSVTSDNENAAKIDGNATEVDGNEVFMRNFTFLVKGVLLGKSNLITRLERKVDSREWQQRYQRCSKETDRTSNWIPLSVLVYANCIIWVRQSCSPGGTGSNFWTLLFNGDVNLSVTMTLFSTIAALGMMPLWLFLVGGYVTDDPNFVVPYQNMIISLLGLTIPIAIGLLIQRYKPNLAEISKKILRPFTVILLIIVITGGIYINFYIFQLFEWIIFVAGACVAWGGYLCGAVIAALFQLPRKQVIAVSIETALQNPGVAFVLLQTSLPQPDSDLAAIPIVGQMLVTGPPLWTLYILIAVFKKIRNQSKVSKEKKETSKDENNEVEKFLEMNENI
ncbi:P3 protein-like protein [Dinothrombium tinctorium]|uniref:P3 protein-like protein n=1 Tax=Dinothrombium tinctorium TaxID=1965070 RepID=A0A3S3Q7Y4_9ACAR|nr:P3 protein-like protein [Dinothrombium tinctorium]RWS15569.1 P3 protein-like protein [Dinothrombium tinctorium]